MSIQHPSTIQLGLCPFEALGYIKIQLASSVHLVKNPK